MFGALSYLPDITRARLAGGRPVRESQRGRLTGVPLCAARTARRTSRENRGWGSPRSEETGVTMNEPLNGEKHRDFVPSPTIDVPQPKKSKGGKILAVALAVVAVLIGVGIGQSAAAPTPSALVSAAGATVTKTVTTTSKATSVRSQTAMVTTTVTEMAPAATVTKEAPTITVTEEAPAGPAASIRDGVSLVGVDVQPGTYRSDSQNCYFARLSGTSGEFTDIIANGFGATIVTIKASDKAFESSSCGEWTKVA